MPIMTKVSGGSNDVVIATNNRIVGGTGTPGVTQADGQSFSLSSSILAFGIYLNLMKSASPVDGLLVELLTGSMTGSVIASGSIANVSSLSSSVYKMTSIPFTTPVQLSASTTYYIRVTRVPDSEDVTNYVLNGGAGSNSFSQGSHQYKFSNAWNNDVGDDMWFVLMESEVNLPTNMYRKISVGNGMSRSEGAT